MLVLSSNNDDDNLIRRQRDELPALPGVEEEEVKMVRQKLKEVQITNREQVVRLKDIINWTPRLEEIRLKSFIIFHLHRSILKRI